MLLKKIYKFFSHLKGGVNEEIILLRRRNKLLQKVVFGAYVQLVMKETGWDKTIAEFKLKDAKKRTGCSYQEYYKFKLFDFPDDELEKVLLFCINTPLSKKYNVNRDFIKIVRDKAKTNEKFSKYILRPWCLNKKVSIAQFKEIFQGSSRIIYKPLFGVQGHGIKAFEINYKIMETIYNELKQLPEGIVEEYVMQHPLMNELNPSSVNTLRVVTVSKNSKNATNNGLYIDIAFTSLRIGVDVASVVDNFHSGGMVANVSMKTGCILTNAVDGEMNVFDYHPVTGVKIKGFKIPCYFEALEMVREAIKEHNIQGYLGWDIAITQNGPVLIEINSNPGTVLLTAPYLPEKIGMKHVLTKYL